MLKNEENELILLTQKKDFRAFEKLVSIYEDMIYSLAYRVMGNSEDAEEVLQECFLNAYRAILQFRFESRFSTWLYRIAYNLCLTKLKKRPNNNVDIYDELFEILQVKNLHDWGSIPDRVVISKEFYSAIEKAVAELPPQNRAIFILRDIEEYTTQEVSDITSLSLSAVKSRLHRARFMLRHLLADYFAKQARPRKRDLVSRQAAQAFSAADLLY